MLLHTKTPRLSYQRRAMRHKFPTRRHESPHEIRLLRRHSDTSHTRYSPYRRTYLRQAIPQFRANPRTNSDPSNATPTSPIRVTIRTGRSTWYKPHISSAPVRAHRKPSTQRIITVRLDGNDSRTMHAHSDDSQRISDRVGAPSVPSIRPSSLKSRPVSRINGNAQEVLGGVDSQPEERRSTHSRTRSRAESSPILRVL